MEEAVCSDHAEGRDLKSRGFVRLDDDEGVMLGICRQLDADGLRRALPLTPLSAEQDTLLCVICNGRDYLGACTWPECIEFFARRRFVPIDDHEACTAAGLNTSQWRNAKQWIDSQLSP